MIQFFYYPDQFLLFMRMIWIPSDGSTAMINGLNESLANIQKNVGICHDNLPVRNLHN